jgi:hypothetical protein
MNQILAAVSQVNFLHMLWLFFFVFVAHELEEWNIDRFEHRHFTGLSPAATDRSARMWIACVVLIGLLWVTIATLSGSPTSAAWIFLPAVAILIQNALQHVFWSLYFRRYAPGVVTALVLLIPIGVYIMITAVQRGYTPAWYAAIWTVFIAAGFIQTVIAGSRMTPLIRGINLIGIKLAEMIPPTSKQPERQG